MIPTMNLSRFIYNQGRKHPGNTGELSDLLSSITLGIKVINNLIGSAGLKGLYGYTGRTNVQGESVQILDEEADQVLVEMLGSSGHFGLLVSEEHERVIAASEGSENAKYVLAFDPLDGSSNLGSHIPVGTIFAIWRKKSAQKPADISDFMQSGRNLVGAGYAVYGSKTSFVYSVGHGVHEFILDESIGEFVLIEESVKSPEHGSTYSVNEGNSGNWEPSVTKFIEQLKTDRAPGGKGFTARYSGSLVADFDRNLKRGGIFLYPGDAKNLQGKLRLLYECIPLAFIAEQAGGRAVDGKNNILDILPKDIHQRAPLIIGSRAEVDLFESLSSG